MVRERSDHRVPGDGVPAGHPVEERPGLVDPPVARERGEHGVVGDGVAAGHRVEQAARRRQLARPREAGELLVATEHCGGCRRRGDLGRSRGGHGQVASAGRRQPLARTHWARVEVPVARKLENVIYYLETGMDWA